MAHGGIASPVTGQSDSPEPAGFATRALVALSIALPVGLLEGAVAVLRVTAFDAMAPLHTWTVAFAVLSAAVCLAPPAFAALLVDAVLRPRLPRRVWRLCVVLACTPAAFSAAQLIPRIHDIARLLLAVGAGGELAPLLAPGLPGTARRARRVVVGSLLLTALATAGLALRGPGLAPATTAPAQPGPNVLLIVLDTVRADHLSFHGYARPTTPRLGELAASGVCFERAFSSSSWTLPAHASVFTGRTSRELSTGWTTPLDGVPPTLAETLAARGYTTGGIVSNRWMAGRQTGIARGFASYTDATHSLSEIVEHNALARVLLRSGRVRALLGWYDVPGRFTGSEINARALDWIDARDTSRPFLLFLNYFDAHHPYLPAHDDVGGALAPRDAAARRTIFELLHDARVRTPDEPAVRLSLDAYDACLMSLDRDLGALFDGLAARGLADDTLVIVTADHGESFAEHGQLEHGHTLYAQETHVPLVLAWPRGLPAGVRVAEPVTTASVAATVADLVGAGAGALPGHSLRPLAEGATGAPQDRVEMHLGAGVNAAAHWHEAEGDLDGVVADGHHLVRRADGTCELYDLAADPAELHDLAADPAHAERVQALLRLLPPRRGD